MPERQPPSNLAIIGVIVSVVAILSALGSGLVAWGMAGHIAALQNQIVATRELAQEQSRGVGLRMDRLEVENGRRDEAQDRRLSAAEQKLGTLELSVNTTTILLSTLQTAVRELNSTVGDLTNTVRDFNSRLPRPERRSAWREGEVLTWEH